MLHARWVFFLLLWPMWPTMKLAELNEKLNEDRFAILWAQLNASLLKKNHGLLHTLKNSTILFFFKLFCLISF